MTQALFRRYPAQALILLARSSWADAAVWVPILKTAKSDEVWLLAADQLAKRSGGPVDLLENSKVAAA